MREDVAQCTQCLSASSIELVIVINSADNSSAVKQPLPKQPQNTVTSGYQFTVQGNISVLSRVEFWGCAVRGGRVLLVYRPFVEHESLWRGKFVRTFWSVSVVFGVVGEPYFQHGVNHAADSLYHLQTYCWVGRPGLVNPGVTLLVGAR